MKSPSCELTPIVFTGCNKLKTVILAGSGTQWDNTSNELSEALIWCVEDGTVYGTLDPVTIAGEPDTGATVDPDQPVNLSVEYTGDMPDGTRIRLDLAMEGMTPSSREMMLTSAGKTGLLKCVVTGDYGTDATCTVERAGGQEPADVTEWTAKIAPAPYVEISTTPSGTLTEGEEVTVTVTGKNIGPANVQGTLAVEGVDQLQRSVTAPFNLSQDAPATSLPYVVQEGASAVDIPTLSPLYHILM